ncbi:MAG TPA: hypothetical protein VIJ87_05170 [Pyrinomonadaceae bacterium]
MTETETNPFINQDELQQNFFKLELKLQAYRERVANYEDQDADRRVQITLLGNENDRLKSRIEELENNVRELESVKEETEASDD